MQPQFSLAAEETLKANNFALEVLEFTSPVTQIRYKFPRYVNLSRTEMYMPLIAENQNNDIVKLYIRGTGEPGKQTDAEGFIAANPGMGLVIYPNPKDINRLPSISGMKEALDNGYFLVVPSWCSDALIKFETFIGQQNQGDFTSILEDKIVIDKSGNKTIFNRKSAIEQGRGGLDDPVISNSLNLVTDDNRSAFWKDLKANPGFRSKYIALREFHPKKNVTVDIIGRPFCLDVLSEFVIPAAEMAVQVVEPKPTQFLGGLLTGEQQQAPSVFQSSTFQPGGFRPKETVSLTSEMIDRLDNFLRKQECRKSRQIRLESIVKKIVDESSTGFPNFNGKHLNISTCQFGKLSGKSIYGRVLSLIPNSNQSLNLSIGYEDLSLILTGSPQMELSENTWGPYIDALFLKAQSIIFSQLGTTTTHAEQGVVSVTSSILDILPAGPNPLGLPEVKSRSPFIQSVPLAGITEVTAPVTSGTRCVPGIMAKKRD